MRSIKMAEPKWRTNTLMAAEEVVSGPGVSVDEHGSNFSPDSFRPPGWACHLRRDNLGRRD